MKTSKSRESRWRVSPALILSLIALFCAMSGAAVALPGTNTVNSGDVIDESLKSRDLKDGKAVQGADVVPGSLTRSNLAPGAVGPQQLSSLHTHSDAVVVSGGVAHNGDWNSASASATCGAGEQLVSASAYWSNNAAGEELAISEVAPNYSTESVNAVGINDSGNDRTMVVVATCLS